MKHLFKCCTLFYIVFIFSCENENTNKEIAENTTISIEKTNTTNKTYKESSQNFKDYWYKGEAEISSYRLEQARYGEIREGQAVLIYVTEDFLPNKQVKADNQNPANIPILKLNTTKKFNTGIYPYSIMQSTFYPVNNEQHAIKVSGSMQEWCGHAYVQLNNREQFEITTHSYFETEADKKVTLNKAILENELWTQLRIDPQSLPTGTIEIVPSMEYYRLKHIDLKSYKAIAKLSNGSYSISYPELKRDLIINFNPEFPHDIISWEETFKSGFDKKTKTLTTKATRLKTIKSPYWNKNRNKDEILRKTLQLD